MHVLGNHGNMICRHREEWLGHIEMMTALSVFYNWMKRGKDKRFLSQLACFIDCVPWISLSQNMGLFDIFFLSNNRNWPPLTSTRRS